ncbi:glycerol-3-phosphate ABC transporter permease [Devosia riboflavina]|uniref:sn-glycerol-3-phosphate transport system permease protein UgpE n=3 Tax=Devosia TaxID=46913 RepID=A0A934MKY2_9HYPH|nr:MULTISPECIES: carbohydrate ABC transporter permease [Devosia]MBU1334313.1 carbohydrate ABC transporter permease [Alphaproteobacteria bacterium]ODU82063.1 MAG: glycerol-3-phosphate ABC transporter permease [Pelagibacterium sp. SCN 63-17]KFL32604.1 glycerol-3-phosphate ABC transporter permease [Devosia riboflavina]MBJ3785643.1 carbohydrate ABC transporter permease [Devosia sediminis]MBU1559657.1 carbohydrate ABC transporter permease [Alphaproteobacteria bacterium]
MKLRQNATTALALVAGLLFLSPVLYSIWMSFQTAQSYYRGGFEFSLGNYGTAVTKFNFARYLVNSIIVSGMVTLVGLAVSTTAAFAFARFDFKGRDLLFGITVATLMIPSHITLIPNYLTLARVGLLDTYAGLILPAISNGFAAFFLRQYIRGIPRALDEAAYMDGARPLQVLWRVIVPISRPAIFSMGLYIFLGEWNNYIWPLVAVGKEDLYTLQLGLARLYSVNPGEGLIDWPLVMAASTITILPVLFGFFLVERHLVRGITMGAVK